MTPRCTYPVPCGYCWYCKQWEANREWREIHEAQVAYVRGKEAEAKKRKGKL